MLKWSGFIIEEDEKIKIKYDSLTDEDKAYIFEIINCDEYWNEENNEASNEERINSYRKYMDICLQECESEITNRENGKDEASEMEDVDSRVIGGSNTLLYGVPGAGKSYTISTEYCNDDNRMDRIIFHPDYTYSDFIGQILPQDVDGIISYKFMPGPFT